jgi:hypothetical protein
MVFCRLLVSGWDRDLANPKGSWGGRAHVAQLVERVLGKDEVISSILIMGSINEETLGLNVFQFE